MIQNGPLFILLPITVVLLLLLVVVVVVVVVTHTQLVSGEKRGVVM